MRINCKRIIYVVIFFLLLALLTQRISWVVQAYGTEKGEVDRRSCLFFALPENTVDCLFLGTSHVYCSFIPKQIYDTTGITSASIATSSQSFQNSYWLLREALHHQTPKVVVLDMHSITTAVDEKVQQFRLHYTSGISILPDISVTKLRAYWDIKNSNYGWSNNLSIYDAYSFFEYKDEYVRNSSDMGELFKQFFNPVSGYHTFGYYPATTIVSLEELVPSVTSDDFIDMYDTLEYKYLNKIYELTKDNGISLILTRAPYTTNLDDYHLYEQVFLWANEREIEIVDYFSLINELEIDLQTDFRDEDHLNYLGAKKATDFLAKVLHDKYNLEDHRGERKYSLWENNTFDYRQIEADLLKQLK